MRALDAMESFFANFKATTGTFLLSLFAQFNPQKVIVALTIFVLACQAVSWVYRGYRALRAMRAN